MCDREYSYTKNSTSKATWNSLLYCRWVTMLPSATVLFRNFLRQCSLPHTTCAILKQIYWQSDICKKHKYKWVKYSVNERQIYVHWLTGQFCTVDNRFTSGWSYTQWVPTSWKYCNINNSINYTNCLAQYYSIQYKTCTTALWQLYQSACARWHPKLTTGRFRWKLDFTTNPVPASFRFIYLNTNSKGLTYMMIKSKYTVTTTTTTI